MASFKLPDFGKFSFFSLLSFLFGIMGVFARPLCILAIAAGIAGLVQISKTPNLKLKSLTKIMAIIGVALGSITAIFLIKDLIFMEGVFKNIAEIRQDIITYFGKKSEGIVGNVSDLTNMTGGLEGL